MRMQRSSSQLGKNTTLAASAPAARARRRGSAGSSTAAHQRSWLAATGVSLPVSTRPTPQATNAEAVASARGPSPITNAEDWESRAGAFGASASTLDQNESV